jgi:hypothetical protein
VFKIGIFEISLALLTATPVLAQMGMPETGDKATAQTAGRPAPQPHNQGQQPK